MSKRARGDAVAGKVLGHGFLAVAGARHHKEHVALPHTLLHIVHEAAEGIVEADVGVLQFHGALVDGAVVEVARIVCDGEHVGDGVQSHAGRGDAMVGKAVDLLIHHAAGLELAVGAVAFEAVRKRFLHAPGDKVAEVAHHFVGGLPVQVANALGQGAEAAVCQGPRRELAIVGGGAPLAGEVVERETCVGGMACGEDGRVAGRERH